MGVFIVIKKALRSVVGRVYVQNPSDVIFAVFFFFYHILSSIQHLESQYPLVGYNPHRPWPTGAMLKALRVNVHLDVIRFALQ